MKRISIFLVLILVLFIIIVPFAFAFASRRNNKLNSVRRPSNRFVARTCDNGTTFFVKTTTDEYEILTIVTKQGVFYIIADHTGKHSTYQAAGSQELMELSHKMWDAKLKESAINTYNNIHGISWGDCKIE